jgi:hypothetical protein
MEITKNYLKTIFWTLTLIFIMLCLESAEATLFRNSYVSFELPPNWKCQVEETEWVCQALNTNKSREAVIILTAKEVGPMDSLHAYSTHLKAPKTLSNGMASKIYFSRQININSHPWIDGMQFASELPNYFTRYLATVKGRIAILVTFSSHKLHYTKYSNDFFKAIMSLRVVASQNLLANNRPILRPGGGETMGINGTNLPMVEFEEGMPSEEDNRGSSSRSTIFLLAIIIAALGIYLYIKNRKG